MLHSILVRVKYHLRTRAYHIRNIVVGDEIFPFIALPRAIPNADRRSKKFDSRVCIFHLYIKSDMFRRRERPGAGYKRGRADFWSNFFRFSVIPTFVTRRIREKNDGGVGLRIPFFGIGSEIRRPRIAIDYLSRIRATAVKQVPGQFGPAR